MAKGRGRLLQAQKAAKQQHHKSKKQKTGNNNSSSNAAPPSAKPKPKTPQPKHHLTPVIPFSPADAILLVGEGDLSFAASLVSHHACTSVTATVLEPDRAALLSKYPHAESNVALLEAAAGCRVLYGIDARKMGPFATKPKKHAEEERVGTMKRIIFNFPHVGGKSTDVNRQVRLNQELLVDFFKRALPSLAPGGSIVVTLFEGEPYTLWNIRDLARHAGGLAVERSFHFRADAYPGYHHARTLGVVRRKDGEVSQSGWKGEERAARSYIFVRKEDAPVPGAACRKRRRREGSGSGSDSESEESESEDEDGGVPQRWEEEGEDREAVDEGEEDED